MVGANHQTARHPGNRVLRHHAHPRLGIAQHEIHRRCRLAFERRHLSCQRLDRRADVHGVDFVRGDAVERGLGVVLVELGFVGQAHGDEFVAVVAGFFAQFTYRALGQEAGGQ